MLSVFKIHNRTKRQSALMLVFFLLAAGLGNSFAHTLKVLQKGEICKSAAAKIKQNFTLDAVNDDICDAAQADLSDADAENAEFVYFDNSQPKFLQGKISKYSPFGFTLHENNVTTPLYVIFCNWKFHLG